ncbi:hypothetical protein, partial [Streptomyces sp. NPDC001226]
MVFATGVERLSVGSRGRKTATAWGAREGSERRRQEGGNRVRRVGVEEELLLVDPDSGDPKALSGAVLAHAAQD